MYVEVGVLLKSKGLKGELKVSFEAFVLEYLTENELDHFFVLEAKSYVPYFVEYMKVQGNGEVIIKFEDMDNRSQSDKIQKRKLYAEANKFEAMELSKEEYAADEWDFLVDFQILTAEGRVFGQILDVVYFPQHELAQVQHQDKVIFVPLHQNLITNIDETTRTLVMTIPEGLVDAQ